MFRRIIVRKVTQNSMSYRADCKFAKINVKLIISLETNDSFRGEPENLRYENKHHVPYSTTMHVFITLLNVLLK